jgi:hypothetical protein
MCTVNSDSEVMVCDVSRDRVRQTLLERVGDAARVETVHGEGTRFTCVTPERVPEFQASVRDALGWDDGAFRQS